ncbi:MAG TPA: lamin tail domain-containing protein [Ignavibacteriaceae bacterium]|nr:lamin tail domain-containing protein [Ignavibacteriaceae bacterium]
MKKFLLILSIFTFFLMIDNSFGQSSVVMNEIFSRGVAPNLDWIEIYNPAATQVDLTGYKIYDDGGYNGTKPKKEFPSGTIIPAGGFYVIVTDEDGVTVGSKFGLSSNGDQVWLENAVGEVIDTVKIPAMPIATTSYGRYPDGGPNKQIFTTITRGTSNVVTNVDGNNITINEYVLNQNYPNPFNPTTTISYQIGKQSFVSLKVYNLLGKEVATLINEVKSPGTFEVKFDGTNLSSGIYFYKLTSDNFNAVKKFTLMK